jgi:hypothetical protein
MRSLLFAPLLLLAACGGDPVDVNAPQGNGAAAPPPGQPDNRIECQPAGAARFERGCTVERANTPRGEVLTIHKADGGFRRLIQARDGTITAADGAQPAHMTISRDGSMEVEIGGDRFRFNWRYELVDPVQRRQP